MPYDPVPAERQVKSRQLPFRRMKVAALCSIATILLLQACSSSPQRRTVGTFIDDQSAEIQVRDVLYSRPEFDERDHIKVEVHNGTMLLAGETSSEHNRALASRLALEMKSVDRVVNELQVGPPADTSGKLHNSYITSKVNSKLLAENPIEGYEGSRVKVMTANGTVYLMGTVTRAEGDAIAEVVRDTGGVDRVVKVFDYIP